MSTDLGVPIRCDSLILAVAQSVCVIDRNSIEAAIAPKFLDPGYQTSLDRGFRVSEPLTGLECGGLFGGVGARS
jgi:hypothetical protein